MLKNSRYSRDYRSQTPKNEVISRVMSANKAKNTKPEIRVRKILFQSGHKGYRLHSPNLPGKPDIVFAKRKIAIFVNGCFWHRCPYCVEKLPKTNVRFWRKKFERNKARDKSNLIKLKKLGWKTITIWECRVSKAGFLRRLNFN